MTHQCGKIGQVRLGNPISLQAKGNPLTKCAASLVFEGGEGQCGVRGNAQPNEII
jgi:hypothetical protein